jgi:hypothetical protein
MSLLGNINVWPDIVLGEFDASVVLYPLSSMLLRPKKNTRVIGVVRLNGKCPTLRSMKIEKSFVIQFVLIFLIAIGWAIFGNAVALFPSNFGHRHIYIRKG